MHPEFTTIVAVDPEHIHELRAVFPTWWHFKPEIFQGEFWVLRDPAVSTDDIFQATNGAVDRIIDVLDPEQRHATQRAKMLNAFVAVASEIPTPWYLKLDTDAVATEPGEWIDPAWFDGRSVAISSPWGYTKPGRWLEELDQWAQNTDPLCFHSPPDRTVVGKVAKSRRIISWVMFGRTDFAIDLWGMCQRTGGVLPVPSQDTTLWYVAARLREPIRRVRFSHLGWRHVNGLARIQVAAEVALAKHGYERDGGFPPREDEINYKAEGSD